jgi:hypothetical protein
MPRFLSPLNICFQSNRYARVCFEQQGKKKNSVKLLSVGYILACQACSQAADLTSIQMRPLSAEIDKSPLLVNEKTRIT